MNQRHIWLTLVVFVLLCFLTELIGGIWTRESVSTWYPKLIKPSWTPPNWLFGPVWTVLYVMIALSGWLIYLTEDSPKPSLALTFFGIQLGFNFIWSFLFFSLQNLFLALVDIFFLWIFIVLTLVSTWKLRPMASLMLIPYFLWVSYALALNAVIWYAN